jgi:hypothetical protein
METMTNTLPGATSAETITNARPNRPKAPKRPVRFAMDRDGTPIAKVTLAGGEVAVIDGPDFDQLMRLGVSPNWTLNQAGTGHAYVRAYAPRRRGSLVTIARLLMRPGRNQRVQYADGDPLNLRRSNLFLGHQGGAGDFEAGAMRRLEAEAGA